MRFDGDELKGKSIVIPGKSFKIRLTSDVSEIRYGFKITEIKPIGEDELDILYYETEKRADGTLEIVGYCLCFFQRDTR
jgi:hypothetical protein